LVAVDDRVSDDPLGDDSHNIVDAWPGGSAKNHRRAGTMPLEPCEHHAQQVLIAADHQAAFNIALNQYVRIAAGFQPQARTRRNESDDASIPLDHDGADIVDVFGKHGLLQSGSRPGHNEAPLHDVLRLLHEIEVDVPLFGDAVAAMTQLDRV